MAENIIETFDLCKVYKLKERGKEIKALDNVNITIERGENFGLLGPNGAGKTTLISILTTLKTPSSGYAIIDGHNILEDPRKAKSKVSLMLESDMLYYRITAYDNLKFFCKIYNITNYKQKIEEYAKMFGLGKWLYEYVENFSSGMKMKLALCRTLLLERDILFLDEPTLGLDVKSISFIVDILKKQDKTIFLTSHDMNVVEKLCDRVAFINHGKILEVLKTSEIENLLQTNIDVYIETMKAQRNQLVSDLQSHDFINAIELNEMGLVVNLKSRKNYSELISVLQNYEIIKIRERTQSLEDLFLKLV
ncbi:MAG: putative ABC transporter ATP-binding protein [Promethearchaeota archaeon]|nr:MAG: putative ABC transporter ATP-binding protein [Candidatus Lokiarchaeota archaeon]